jgi:hypothetical protein
MNDICCDGDVNCNLTYNTRTSRPLSLPPLQHRHIVSAIASHDSELALPRSSTPTRTPLHSNRHQPHMHSITPNSAYTNTNSTLPFVYNLTTPKPSLLLLQYALSQPPQILRLQDRNSQTQTQTQSQTQKQPLAHQPSHILSARQV